MALHYVPTTKIAVLVLRRYAPTSIRYYTEYHHLVGSQTSLKNFFIVQESF